MTARRIYRGSCHCGAVRFSFASEPIEAGCRCNCSICRRRGAIMSAHYIEHDDFVLEPTKALGVYRFGDKVMDHCFCTQCGINPFSSVEGRYRVNLGCVDGIDPWEVEVRDIDGRSY